MDQTQSAVVVLDASVDLLQVTTEFITMADVSTLDTVSDRVEKLQIVIDAEAFALNDEELAMSIQFMNNRLQYIETILADIEVRNVNGSAAMVVADIDEEQLTHETKGVVDDARAMVAVSRSLTNSIVLLMIVVYSFTIAITMIIQLGLLWFFTDRILNPLNNLAEGVHDISQGKFETRVKLPKVDDEMRQITKDVNTSVHNYAKMYNGLERKLVAKIGALQQQEEMQAKQLDDFKTMNDLMVGRELRMAELKTDNDDLRKQVSKSEAI